MAVTVMGEVEAAINPQTVLANVLVFLRICRPLAGRWDVFHVMRKEGSTCNPEPFLVWACYEDTKVIEAMT